MVLEDLPQYQCHKKVRAAKITNIVDYRPHGPDVRLVFGEIDKTLEVPRAWMKRHKPVVGGYYVVYEDNYSSYSPSPSFEGGYSKL